MEILMNRIRGMETTESREEGRMEDMLQILDGGPVLAVGIQEMEAQTIQVAEVPLEVGLWADEGQDREAGIQAERAVAAQAEAAIQVGQAVGMRLVPDAGIPLGDEMQQVPDVGIQQAAAEIPDVSIVPMLSAAERNAELNFLSVCCWF